MAIEYFEGTLPDILLGFKTTLEINAAAIAKRDRNFDAAYLSPYLAQRRAIHKMLHSGKFVLINRRLTEQQGQAKKRGLRLGQKSRNKNCEEM